MLLGVLLKRTSVSVKGLFLILFTEGQLSNSYDVPDGGTTPAHQNDAVTLQLSDGTVAQVFDKLSTGLKL